MMRIFKKILLIISFLGILLLLAGTLLVHFYGSEIKGLIVENLNKNLKTDVEVKEIDFTIWNNFPRASVVFNDVLIHSVNAKNDTLLAAEKLSAQFSLVDLYREQYRLIALEISDGLCYMKVDDSGQGNYIFWNNTNSDSSTFSTELQKVTMNNINYRYSDFSKNIDINIQIAKAKLNGNFQNSLFDLEIKTDIEQAKIQLGTMSLFDNRPLFLDMEGTVNQKEGLLSFNNASLTIDLMTYNVLGSYEYEGLNNLNLTISSKKVDLSKTIALLPTSVKEKLKRFDINGKASFDGSISGKISKPAYNFNFSAQQGELNAKNSDLSFKKIFLKGTITNGNDRSLKTTALKLEEFQCNLSNGQIKGKLSVVDFEKPRYEYEGKIVFELQELVDLIKWNQLSEVAGSIETNTKIAGEINEVGKYSINDWKKSKVEGEMTMKGLSFKLEDNPRQFSQINGDFSFNNNSINVTNLRGKVGKTKLNIEGKFNNLIAFLIEKDEPLFVDAQLKSTKVDLAELMTQESREGNNQYQLEISPKLTVYLQTEVDTLLFNKFEMNQLSSIFVVKNKRIDARGVTFDSQGGSFQGDFFIKESGNNKLTLYSEAELIRVDINKLFYSFNNFGQNVLQQNNISGTADASIRFHSEWSRQLEINQKSIQVDADIIIDNGVLTNFSPLESLSNFVELEELKEVKFQQVKNQILIKDELITLPKFDLRSSALNLSVEGTHSFTNEINYHFTLLLSEILGKKAKKPKNSEFGYVEDDGLGRTQLFLKMTGTVENPQIKYDKKELKNNIKKEIEDEKNLFKSILKEEFGLFKKDTSIKAIPIGRKQSPFQVEIDSSYLNKKTKVKENINEKQEEKGVKSKFGKFLDKIAKPNEEEFVDPIDN